jgi:hypothetical protein
VITKWRIGRSTLLPVLAASVLASVSCGSVARSGRSPSFLVIDLLAGASGATPGEFGNVMASDVVTLVTQTVNAQQVKVPTVFEDPGQATLRVLLKDQGSPGVISAPSNLNWLKLTRYRVVYRRADGRNTPGVDVPYAFDGALTATITNTPITVNLTLVRLQAKIEAPLAALASGGAGVISTIADVTFYGQDLAGNAFAETGSISINFANWGDPE